MCVCVCVFVCMYVCMYVCMHVCQLGPPLHGREPLPCVLRQDFFYANVGSSFLPYDGLGSGGGVINTRPVKPFETGPVIKGYTNTIVLNLI